MNIIPNNTLYTVSRSESCPLNDLTTCYSPPNLASLYGNRLVNDFECDSL